MGIASFSGASSVIKPGVVTSSTRPSSPFVGQLIYETDTTRLAAYNGSAWVTQNGLQLVAAASFSGVTSVQVNNCFTSTYRNYRIYIDCVGVTNSNKLSMRLSVSGTPSTTGYYSGMQAFDYTTSGAFSSSLTSDRVQIMWVGSTGAAANAKGAFVDVMRPQLAVETDFLSMNNGVNAGVAYQGGLVISAHTVSTAYDGFTIINSAGTNIAGAYRVYGLADS
jgi:hypothetical protein